MQGQLYQLLALQGHPCPPCTGVAQTTLPAVGITDTTLPASGVVETTIPAAPGIEVVLSLLYNVEDNVANVPLYITPASENVLVSVRGDRPSRIKKNKGQDKIKNILKMTEDSITDSILNEPLVSSDFDVYEPSSSSSDEE